MSKISNTLLTLLIFSLLPISTINAEALKENEFEYIKTDESIEITKYTGGEGSNIIIPEQIDNNDVISIGVDAFSDLQLEKIEFPKTLKVIKEGAFKSNKFKSIVLNDGLKIIESGAFADGVIEELTLPQNIEAVADDAFTENNIKTVYGHENSYAQEWTNNQGFNFECLDCTPVHEEPKADQPSTPAEQPPENKDSEKAKEEKRSEGTNSIAVKNDFISEDFEKGKIITKYTGEATVIDIPNTISKKNVIKIDEEVFADKDIESVKLPANLKIIGKKAFNKNRLTEITLPDGLIEIGERAFERNEIKNVTIPESVRIIGADAFKMKDPIKITISGYKNSEAERYADKENFTFKCLNCDDETEIDTSIALNMSKKDFNYTVILDERNNLKLDNIVLNYEMKFGKDLEDEITVNYRMDEFIHVDGVNKLNPIDESEFYEKKLAGTFDSSTSKEVNDYITIDFLEFNSSEFVKKGEYKSVIMTEILASPST